MKKMLTASLSLLSLLLVSANAHADQPDCGASFGDCYASTLKEIQQLRKDLTEQIKQNKTPVGEVVAFSGDKTTVPDGWLLCDGSELSAATYPELFAVIKNMYGTANVGSFKLPDYRGVFLRGVDGGANKDPDAAKRTALVSGGNVGDAVGSLELSSLNKDAFSDFKAGLYDLPMGVTNGQTAPSLLTAAFQTQRAIALQYKNIDPNWENWEKDSIIIRTATDPYSTYQYDSVNPDWPVVSYSTNPNDPKSKVYPPNYVLFGSRYDTSGKVDVDYYNGHLQLPSGVSFGNQSIFTQFSPEHFTTETRPTNVSVNYIIYTGKQMQTN